MRYRHEVTAGSYRGGEPAYGSDDSGGERKRLADLFATREKLTAQVYKTSKAVDAKPRPVGVAAAKKPKAARRRRKRSEAGPLPPNRPAKKPNCRAGIAMGWGATHGGRIQTVEELSFFSDLLEVREPIDQSKYAVVNGYMYLALGGLFIVWPGSVQTIFMDRPFVGDESALFRVAGMAVTVIGWLYVFGGRSGARQFGPASVLDRVVLVPAVLLLS